MRSRLALLFTNPPAPAFLIPFCVFLLFIFVAPLSLVASTSVHDGQWTLEGYRRFVTEPLFLRVLVNTLTISVLTAITSVTLGYVVAYHLSKMGRRKRAIYMTFVLLPFWTSILVKSFAFTVILGSNGIINNLILAAVGPGYSLPMLFNRVGVIIGLTHWLLPFAVFPILSSLISQDAALRTAGAVMGASRFYIFTRITLPLSRPGVIAGGLMTAVLAMGSFVTPALLGGRKDIMLANLVDFYVREVLDWNMASSIAVILIGIAGIAFLLVAALRHVIVALGGRAEITR